MNHKTVNLEKSGGIAKIVLNCPEQRNALTPQLMQELIAALEETGRDEGIGVVFITGAGEDFCAGMDLKFSLASIEGRIEDWEPFLPLGYQFPKAVEGVEKPVIAAVNGRAIAGGFILVFWCDLAIAEEDARIGDAHARWGMVPAWYEPIYLSRLLGVRNAKRIFLTDDLLSAEEAREIGLVYKIFPKGKLDEGIETIGNQILKLSKFSLANIKRQIDSTFKQDWRETLTIDKLIREGDKRLVAGCFSPDSQQRLAAFRGKTLKSA